MKKIKIELWDSAKVMSISAMLVSAITLIVLIYQTSLMREQQRLSVLPYLSIRDVGYLTDNY